jgi:hypothetical protein
MTTNQPTSQPPGTEQQMSAAEQAAYQRGRHEATRQLTTPKMTGYRIACGICWAFWTFLLFLGFVFSITSSPAAALFALVLSGLAGWYDYRIWTLRARRLTFFLIF